jgi:hypothetical protein
MNESFLKWIWKITGGNAEVFENTGVDKKAIRKLKKTKGRFCTVQCRVMRDEQVCNSVGRRNEMVAEVPPLRSPSPKNRAEE